MRFYRKIRTALWKLSMKGLQRGPHITRYAMYSRLKLLGANLPSKSGRVLAISKSANLCDVLGLQPTEIIAADYPDQNMLSLNFSDCSFDFVVSDQVLEHVEGDPQKAIDESWRVLRPGGIAIHTTCFINPIHGFPKDYWRFTPDALRLLSKKFTQIIECDGWGNFDTWLLIRDGLRFEGIPHAKWHPLHQLAMKNDPDWPIVTWMIAKK
jgi:SAM-dependent methyltransferase